MSTAPVCTLPACPCRTPCQVYARCQAAAEKLATGDAFDIARAIARYASTIPIEACSP